MNAPAPCLSLIVALLASGCISTADGSAVSGNTPTAEQLAAVTAAEREQVFPRRPAFRTRAQETTAAVEFEETLAGCMRRQGHRYEVVAYAPPTVVDDPGDLLLLGPLDLDGEDAEGWIAHARSHGYGWVYASRAQNALDLFPDVEDLNLAIQRELADTDRRSYFSALYGERYPDGEPLHADEQFPPFDPDAGCWGEALASHQPLSLLRRLPEEAIADLDEPGDQTAAEAAWSAWSECMSRRGFPDLASRWDAVALAERIAGVGGGSAMSETDASERAPAPPDWVATAVSDGTETRMVQLPPLDEEALADERSLAVADAECDTKTGLAAALRGADIERQNAFIAKWRDELVEIGVLDSRQTHQPDTARG